MNVKEFKEVFERQLIQHNIIQQTFDSDRRKNSFYYQTYSSMNEILNAEMYDLEGGQFWINIPCKTEGLSKFLVQLNFRLWDKATFRANPDFVINSMFGHFFLFHDWSAIVNAPYIDKTKRWKETKNGIKYVHNSFSYHHHYEPDEQFFTETVLDMITAVEAMWTNPDLIKALENYLDAPYEKTKKEILKTNIRPIVKRYLDDLFKIK